MKRRAVMAGIAGAVALLAAGSARAFTMGETNAALATQGTLNASGASNPAAARKSVADGLKKATAARSKADRKAAGGGAKSPGGFGGGKGGKGGKGSWVAGGELGGAKTGGKGSWVGAGATKGGGKSGWASVSAKSSGSGWAGGGAMGGKASKKSSR